MEIFQGFSKKTPKKQKTKRHEEIEFHKTQFKIQCLVLSSTAGPGGDFVHFLKIKNSVCTSK